MGQIFKTDIIHRENLQLDEKLYQSEDMIFILEYMQYVKNWKIVDQYSYHYNRLNDNSISKNINDSYLENYKRFYKELFIKLKMLKFEQSEVENCVNEKIIDTVFYLFLNSTEYKKLCEKILEDKMFIRALEKSQKHKKINHFIVNRNYIRLNVYLNLYRMYLKMRKGLGNVIRGKKK